MFKFVKVTLAISIFLFSYFTFGQQSNEQLDAYKQFLSQNKDMPYLALKEMYNSGIYKEKVNSATEVFSYLDSINLKCQLTESENNLLDKHGFMVTERLAYGSFGHCFSSIYHSDLPVFVSSDAIMHAFHVSYDQILKDTELGILIGKLEYLLEKMQAGINVLESKYSANPEIVQNIKDVDFYLAVPKYLLTGELNTYYPENETIVNEFIDLINNESFTEKAFLSEVKRKIDLSQFKIRGHYEDETYPQLGRYFKAMIWLGKMELYLIAPETAENKPTQADVQRQTVDAFLINELLEIADQNNTYETIEATLEAFVGEQDNVKTDHLNLLIDELNISNAADLLNQTKFDEFQQQLSSKSYASQQILSQVLMNDPSTPDSIKPASAFMLLGQRFIIDSYITGNVVFDKIKFEGSFIKRMLPSTLDILFALGNDAAGQLLERELEEYNYSTNLASLRFLIDSHEQDFWDKSIYNLWLNSIRTLNPPADREDLPEFMQTAAWWQQKINSQLGLWTELRHDNLLYAKQSYTGGAACSFPFSYVEPVPEFFNSLSRMAEKSAEKINSLIFEDGNFKNRIIYYLNNFSKTVDTIAVIADKEISNTPLNDVEKQFLKSMLSAEVVGCVEVYDGWYNSLYYLQEENGITKFDLLVADYHTAPTDAGGAFVGWVKHAGTGWVNMAVVKAKLPDGNNMAFVGPVISYFEYTTTNFLRLSDSEWRNSFHKLSLRPDWVNIYLADENGNSMSEGAMLITGIDNEPGSLRELPENYIIAKNYPNPFNNGTIINFIIPSQLSNSKVEVTVFDIQGRKIKTLLNENLPAGNYMTRWYGKNGAGNDVSSGIYFYVINAGATNFTGKMNLLK